MMNAIGYAILFTAHHNIDVLSTIQHLQYQGVAPSQIMLFQGSSSIPTISYEPVAVADKETARSLTKTYAWYLKEASKNFLYTVILEDDLKISPNFVTYMLWGQRVLKYAPDVAVVSAWNDNAVPEVILSPSLVWKVRQFMGLGWIASAETLLALSRAIANAPGQPWDTTTGKYMLKNNLLSVFPQFPRVHHRTASYWMFHKLQMFENSWCTLPSPYKFARRYNEYLHDVCYSSHLHKVDEYRDLHKALKASKLPIPWTKSSMTNSVYGEYKGITVFPDNVGMQHFFVSPPPRYNCTFI